MDPRDHEAHEQRLAAALRDLLQQIDLKEYRDRRGQAASDNKAFLKAQAMVDEFDLTHAQICRTLDECAPHGDLTEAAATLFARRRAPTARPSDTPPEYDTWRSGP